MSIRLRFHWLLRSGKALAIVVKAWFLRTYIIGNKATDAIPQLSVVFLAILAKPVSPDQLPQLFWMIQNSPATGSVP